MLTVRNLRKSFRSRRILDNVSLDLRRGEIVGLIGRSGAGKSTLARCLVGLESAEGSFSLQEESFLPGREGARKDIQYLWQDPRQALSPYLSARETVIETVRGFRGLSKSDARDTATALLTELDIGATLQDRRPHALSGGQCQRVALSRALAAEPRVLILDEPLSSLDLVRQVATIDLLRRLHARLDLAILIISHDLAPLRQLADRVMVLEEGRIVEDIAMAAFFAEAQHPLSRAYARLYASESPRPVG